MRPQQMGRTTRRTWGWAGLVVIVAALALARPWVVVPLHMQATDTTRADVLETAWQRLQQGIKSARPMAQFRAEPGTAVLTHGRGVLVELETASMNGWARLEVLPADDVMDGMSEILLHLGPVVRGTALRDAAGLSYDDFDTQVTYARAASTLNERAMQGLERDQLAMWVGEVVSFAGVAIVPPIADAPVEVVPLMLAVETSP